MILFNFSRKLFRNHIPVDYVISWLKLNDFKWCNYVDIMPIFLHGCIVQGASYR